MISKKKFIPQLIDVNIKDENFATMLEDFDTSHLKEGKLAKGQVIEINSDVLIVDVGLKNEGRIPLSEFKSSPELPKVGDIIEVYVEKIAGNKGTVLSYENAVREKAWVKLEKLFDQGENVIGTIFGRVKGGFTVELNGVVAFLPGSQVDVKPIKDPDSIIDVEQPLRILKMDKKLGNIVVSRKAIIEESRSGVRDEMLATIKEGSTLDGSVKNITDYGAFVDLGSVDGLLHVTDISWSRINHPSEVLTVGQEIKVVVIKFNEDTKRISLGMKQLDQNPWNDINKTLETGKMMIGKITNIADYGVFVEIKDGIEGLVHSSEISWGKTSHHPKKLLTIGQEVEFMILEMDIEKHRISLSMKRCKENPLVKFSKEHPVGSVITAPIRNVTDFGVFVEIDTYTDGMIHESDISWTDNSIKLQETFFTGDKIECKVLNIDLQKDRVSLGIKQLTENPYNSALNKYKKYATVTSVISKIQDDGIAVIVDDSVPGFIKKADLSSDRGDQRPDRFAEGERIDAKIISINHSNSSLILSIKALEMDQRNKAIKEYGSTDSGASLRDILGVALKDSTAAQSQNQNKPANAVASDDANTKSDNNKTTKQKTSTNDSANLETTTKDDAPAENAPADSTPKEDTAAN